MAKCGDCKNWMKKSDCPLEEQGKPSMSHPPCNKYIFDDWEKRLEMARINYGGE